MSAAVRWPRRARPVELVVAETRIGVLQGEKAELVRRLDDARAECVELRRELDRVRGHRARLARAVRERSSIGLPADLLALIEEEGLAE